CRAVRFVVLDHAASRRFGAELPSWWIPALFRAPVGVSACNSKLVEKRRRTSVEVADSLCRHDDSIRAFLRMHGAVCCVHRDFCGLDFSQAETPIPSTCVVNPVLALLDLRFALRGTLGAFNQSVLRRRRESSPHDSGQRTFVATALEYVSH